MREREKQETKTGACRRVMRSGRMKSMWNALFLLSGFLRINDRYSSSFLFLYSQAIRIKFSMTSCCVIALKRKIVHVSNRYIDSFHPTCHDNLQEDALN